MIDKLPLEKKQFPTLQILAENVVARNYHLYPSLPGVTERVRQKIIEKSIEQSTPHDVLLTAPNIAQEKYWKRCCQLKYQHHSTINIELHGMSWKVAYLQRYLQNMLETLKDFKNPKENELVYQTVRLISPWIFTLELRRMPSEMDFKSIADFLPNLSDLHLKYTQGINVEYKKQVFGMKFAEAANLSETLKCATNLLSLNLSGNQIDDDLFKFLMQGLTLNISLVDINLSHNKIGDQGARRLSKYLIKNEILVHLNLSNNIIGYDGSRYIAQALKINKTLESLSLKLNSLNDKAGAKLFKDLAFNTKLRKLDLQANSFGGLVLPNLSQTARKLSLYIQNPNYLHELQIGNNNFTEEHLQTIKIALPDDRLKQHFENSSFNELRFR